MFNYDKDAQLAVDTLSKYDFSDILKSCIYKDVGDIIDDICYSEMSNEEIVNAFDNLSSQEVATYFNKKYNMKYIEVEKYMMWWSNKEKITNK